MATPSTSVRSYSLAHSWVIETVPSAGSSKSCRPFEPPSRTSPFTTIEDLWYLWNKLPVRPWPKGNEFVLRRAVLKELVRDADGTINPITNGHHGKFVTKNIPKADRERVWLDIVLAVVGDMEFPQMGIDAVYAVHLCGDVVELCVGYADDDAIPHGHELVAEIVGPAEYVYSKPPPLPPSPLPSPKHAPPVVAPPPPPVVEDVVRKSKKTQEIPPPPAPVVVAKPFDVAAAKIAVKRLHDSAMTSLALVVYTEEVTARKRIYADAEATLSNLIEPQKAKKPPPPPPAKKKPTPSVVQEPVAPTPLRPKHLVPPGAVFIGVIAFLMGLVLWLHLF